MKMETSSANNLTQEIEDNSEENNQKWTVIETAELESVDQFWSSIEILNKNLHIVLPRVCGSVLAFSGKLLSPLNKKAINFKSFASFNLGENGDAVDILEQLKVCGMDIEMIEDTEIYVAEVCYVTVQKLILNLQGVSTNLWVLAVIDHKDNEAMYVLLESPTQETTTAKLKVQSVFPFKICYEDCSIRLMKVENDKECDSYWLKNTLLTKLLKWAHSLPPSKTPVKSLSLIGIEEYVKLYHTLKEKYGSHMVKIWPERTDPQKFVYEDVAIATYLLLLWQKQREEAGRPQWMQSFVDLGCGNGLLVYILSSEGHVGKGLDIRKRSIWDVYPESTQLQVDTITPSDNFLFPDTDWIIGNHSDELTPWIPVIAARSSYKCCFFLLPCCFYDFTGNKYQRQNTELSQYEDYLEYLKYICEVCGFKIQIDRLKIPSTKRICLIGAKRTHIETESDMIHTNILQLLESKNDKGKNVGENSSSEWMSGFKARESVERVRNCTQLDSGLRIQIVNMVTQHLLAKRRLLKVMTDNGEKKMWNAGGVMSIGEIAAAIPTSLLQQLKNECGGLQTLLKNSHHIFFVHNGNVQFRTPENVHNKTAKNKHRKRKKEPSVLKHKIKPCWFHENHPDGCFLPDEICTFKH
ncbi:probable tRNA (uracil-O(2)-)-methyltransferase [Schistocerca serialis cubense]|uniref:probable tRNA (uracil-O(2)-)-methyltransferase n=1 Tax=Schistocerca serialis cubense TaxID=2023355 RepID=UPI00214E3E1C|nr:probable tRNA (uracil-O(2)-)-methyltransferase [Schistocerca serialis cubense]